MHGIDLSAQEEAANINREEFYYQNYIADSQADYPDSGDINITNTGVEKQLRNLHPHKPAGPDNIRTNGTQRTSL